MLVRNQAEAIVNIFRKLFSSFSFPIWENADLFFSFFPPDLPLPLFFLSFSSPLEHIKRRRPNLPPLVFSPPPALPSQMLLIGNRRNRKEKGRRNHHLGSSTSWSSSFQYWRQSGSGRGEKDGIGRFLPFSTSFFQGKKMGKERWGEDYDRRRRKRF